MRRGDSEPLTPEHFQQSVKHILKQMFLGVFPTNCTGSLVPVQAMMNSVKYIQILRNKIVPFVQTFSGTFQRVPLKAPCHNSKLVKTFILENQINVFYWAGNSPDLNPIENLWNILKICLGKTDSSTTELLV